MALIDLHTHSSASDGALSPSELAALAKKEGLAAVALTDHDTVEGIGEFLAAGRRLQMEVIPGLEISARRSEGKSMHLIGLYLDHRQQGLLKGLARLQRARAERNPRIVAKLNRLGIPLTMEQVEQIAGSGQVGRPHFASALVQMGVVADSNEAFRRFLAYGAAAYEPKFRLAPDRALALLRAAGGVPVLAHPGLLKLPLARLEELVAGLRPLGLEGIEAFYSEHQPSLSRELVRLAARQGLVVSGGSDFHGAHKPGIALGRGQGSLRVEYKWLAAIKQRHQEIAGQGRGRLHAS